MNALIDEIVDFIIANYDDANFTDRVALSCFVAHSRHIHIERKDGKIIMLAIFFMVDGKSIDRIAQDPMYQEDCAFVNDCMKQNGEHAHVYMAVHTGDVGSMIRCVRSAIIHSNPRTVSWYSPDMSRFHIKNIRRSTCLTQYS